MLAADCVAGADAEPIDAADAATQTHELIADTNALLPTSEARVNNPRPASLVHRVPCTSRPDTG
jgi:hypothetical protein